MMDTRAKPSGARERVAVADPDPQKRLDELVAEVKRHREALLEYRQSAFPEMAEMHRLRLLELYAQIRQHCGEHGLVIPSSVPIESI
jgi:hypothetical protein